MSLFSRVPPIGQKRQQEMMKAAVPMAYRDVPEGPLNAHLFRPDGGAEPGGRPLVVFFHGGFWDASMPTQFVPHCLHFATRGAVAIAAETRLESLHRAGPTDALEDAAALLEWAVAKKDELGIDPARIILGGSSGGAFLALNLALRKPVKNSPEPVIKPAALVLFSSLLDATRPSLVARFPDPRTAKKLSPLKMMRRHAPPAILFHGRQDRITPYSDVVKFRRGMRWRGNRIELVDYEKADHTFFNFNVSEFYYDLTIRAADQFLVEAGVLTADACAGLD